MNLLDVITRADVMTASALFVALTAAEPFLDAWVHGLAITNPPLRWGWDHFFAPLLRVAVIVIFVYVAYPGLFGLSVAPPLGALLGPDGARTNQILGVLFLFGLLAPMVTLFRRNSELILPLQGVIAVAYVFTWLRDYLYVTSASLLPGFEIFGLMVVAAYVGHRCATVLGKPLGDWLDGIYETDGCDVVVIHAIALATQLPVLLLYGYGLGRQLAL